MLIDTDTTTGMKMVTNRWKERNAVWGNRTVTELFGCLDLENMMVDGATNDMIGEMEGM